MNTIVFVRRFLADYARNPVNLLMLVVVPAVFVVAAAGYLVDAAKLLSDAPAEASSVATATAGWAAAFLAGIAMYFQVSAARDADRGLVVAGLPARRRPRAGAAGQRGRAGRAATAHRHRPTGPGDCRHGDVRRHLPRHRRHRRRPGPQPGQRHRPDPVRVDPRHLLRPVHGGRDQAVDPGPADPLRHAVDGPTTIRPRWPPRRPRHRRGVDARRLRTRVHRRGRRRPGQPPPALVAGPPRVDPRP